MNYRLSYYKITGKEIPGNFDIHHLDQDRTNNEIINLVALPKKLHQDYHTHSQNYEVNISEIIPSFIINDLGVEEYQLNRAIHFFRIKPKCYLWVLFRDHLRGKNRIIFPNDTDYKRAELFINERVAV